MPTGMFADSMLETSWAQRSRQGLTTLTSFGLQAVVISLLLLVPLLRSVGLPTARSVSTPISAGPLEGPPERQMGEVAHRGGQTVVMSTHGLMLPRQMPTTIYRGPDTLGPVPDTAGCEGCVGVIGMPLGVGGGPGIQSILNGTHPVVPVAPKPLTHVFRTSNMLEGSLIRKVQPQYPPLARSARIQGTVVLFAEISTAGTIDNLRVISGHPLLVPAAIDAVRQWRYRPFVLNDEPIEVETQITVNFLLGN
jgi:periplasmic protein TonB